MAAQPAQQILPMHPPQPSTVSKVPLPSSSDWSLEEDSILESALAELWDAPDRLEKAASRLPLRNIDQVRHRFKLLEEDINNIEANRIPLPNYASAQEHTSMERRKGIPWTEEEHRLFLMGLAKFGKGDWRSISRNYVISRTPTQVASHAQKYFIRLNSMNKKDKRRSSIHDITSPGGNTGEVTGLMPHQQQGAQHAQNVMGAVAPGVPMQPQQQHPQQLPTAGMPPRPLHQQQQQALPQPQAQAQAPRQPPPQQ